jgi:hypothetical protein
MSMQAYRYPPYQGSTYQPYVPPNRDVVIYKPHWLKGSARRQYEHELRRRQMQGWQLVSCTQTGRDVFGRSILTAIYEK